VRRRRGRVPLGGYSRTLGVNGPVPLGTGRA
jgi:hypothetical protein